MQGKKTHQLNIRWSEHFRRHSKKIQWARGRWDAERESGLTAGEISTIIVGVPPARGESYRWR